MTESYLQELEKVARAATRGQWKRDCRVVDSVETGETVASAYDENDAAYIAAACPETMLSLIGDVLEARKDACEWINIARWLIRKFGRETVETEMIMMARHALGYENTWRKA